MRIFVLSNFGQEITLNTHGPRERFGELALLDGLPRSASAVSLDRTRCCVLERGDFLNILESHPGMVRSILALLSGRVRHATTYAESLAFLTFKAASHRPCWRWRTATALISAASRSTCDLTQADLASYVAATRESVNKALGTLRDQGLVSIDGQTVTILDVQGLRNLIQY